MQFAIVSFTQYLLCLLSMLLTALFVINFASSDNLNAHITYLSFGVMLCLGLSIDLSKYLFWRCRARHPSFFITSLLLVCFSCAASVSFLVSYEQKSLDTVRVKTAEYRANQSHIRAIDGQLEAKRRLLDVRMSSQYHDQWDLAEAISQDIERLNEQRRELVLNENSMGRNEAVEQLASSAFFSSVSSMVGASTERVTAAFYGLLAALIEVCSLGMISLSTMVRGQDIDPPTEVEMPERKTDNLRLDIIEGRTLPVMRKVVKDYKLQHHSVKTLFDKLVDEGYLMRINRRYERARDPVSS